MGRLSRRIRRTFGALTLLAVLFRGCGVDSDASASRAPERPTTSHLSAGTLRTPQFSAHRPQAPAVKRHPDWLEQRQCERCHTSGD